MKKPPLVICGLCLAFLCHSQSGLYITDATPITINVNNTVSIDGLVLIPSSKYSLSGVNAVTRKSSLTHPSVTPAINRTFLWSANTPAFTGSIGIFYEDGELNGLTETELTLNIHDGTIWKAYNSGVTRNAVTNLVITTVSGLSLNELALASEAAPLPLTWESISAIRKREGASIEWLTHNEINTNYFEVERSINGVHWHRIGASVPAVNTPDRHRYHLIDPTAGSSQTYYRVRQVDFDGQYSFSPIVSIPALQQAVALTLYPNPATQQVFLRSRTLLLKALIIFDASGKQLRTEYIPLTTSYTFSISSLPKGFYTVQVQLSDASTETLCFLKN